MPLIAWYNLHSDPNHKERLGHLGRVRNLSVQMAREYSPLDPGRFMSGELEYRSGCILFRR
jgi:hypothetical protein